MSKVFFIADTHFSADPIRRYENRPFENVTQMDEEMIQNWNQIVSKEDVIYVLGDFGAEQKEGQVLKRLNGTKYLVKGNHDVYANAYYRDAGFAEVYDKPVIFEGFWILSHEPLYVNTNMPYANIFGHVHGSPQYQTYSKQHYCVSVERIGFQPIAFEIIKKAVAEA